MNLLGEKHDLRSQAEFLPSEKCTVHEVGSTTLTVMDPNAVIDQVEKNQREIAIRYWVNLLPLSFYKHGRRRSRFL